METLSIGQCAALACLLEVTTPKPGNVHRGADFEDLCFNDFVASAVAIGPVMERANEVGVGATALAAVRATRQVVHTNTNLGTILLLAPLAAVPRTYSLREGIASVLSSLTPSDAMQTYEAIRLAEPGGLGEATEMDVNQQSPTDLLAAMRRAAERDLVARQYANDFEQVLESTLPWIVEGRDNGWSLTDAVIHAHVQLLAEFPDSLIRRKCGLPVAEQAARLAGQVLRAGRPGESAYGEALADLDFWLRGDHHRRNPGTTADMLAAALFAGLREGVLRPPYR